MIALLNPSFRRDLGLVGCRRGSPVVIRVLIAEDQGMVRGALASLVGLGADIEVVGQVSRGDEVVDVALQARPDPGLAAAALSEGTVR